MNAFIEELQNIQNLPFIEYRKLGENKSVLKISLNGQGSPLRKNISSYKRILGYNFHIRTNYYKKNRILNLNTGVEYVFDLSWSTDKPEKIPDEILDLLFYWNLQGIL